MISSDRNYFDASDWKNQLILQRWAKEMEKLIPVLEEGEKVAKDVNLANDAVVRNYPGYNGRRSRSSIA